MAAAADPARPPTVGADEYKITMNFGSGRYLGILIFTFIRTVDQRMLHAHSQVKFLRVVSRSAKWTSRHLGGSSWNRPQRPNPGHLRDCWGCLGRFLGRLGHRTTAIVSTRGVGKSLEFRPGAPRDFFQVDRNARE